MRSCTFALFMLCVYSCFPRFALAQPQSGIHGYLELDTSGNLGLPSGFIKRTARVTFAQSNSQPPGVLSSSGVVSVSQLLIFVNPVCTHTISQDGVYRFEGIIERRIPSLTQGAVFDLVFRLAPASDVPPTVPSTYAAVCTPGGSETRSGPGEVSTQEFVVPFFPDGNAYAGRYMEIHSGVATTITGVYEGCGDERDTIIGEYQRLLPSFIPRCHDFTTNHRTFNTGDYGWALVRQPLANGYAAITARLGRAVPINSAYRNPVRNQSLIGSSPRSRHMFGDAIDLAVRSRTSAEWLEIYAAATNAGATWLEGQTSRFPCNCVAGQCGCVHAQWSGVAGPYLQ